MRELRDGLKQTTSRMYPNGTFASELYRAEAVENKKTAHIL